MLDANVWTTVGTKFLPAVPALEDLPADMIQGTDFLPADDAQITIDCGPIQLQPSSSEATEALLPTLRSAPPPRPLTLSSVLARHNQLGHTLRHAYHKDTLRGSVFYRL